MSTRKPRTRLSSEDRKYFVAVAAFLSSKGKTQSEISEELDLSQTFVSQLLRDATKAHMLEDRHPEFIREKVNDKFLVRIEREFEAKQELTGILQKESSSFNQIFVVHDTEFVKGAAKVLPGFLSNAVVLGVSFGRTCRELIEAFDETYLPRLEACIPTQGDPIFWNNQSSATLTATRLAQILKKKLLDGSATEQFSLTGVPAYISSNRYDREKVSEFFSDVPGYKAIFGEDGEVGIAERLNGILTGIGIASPDDEQQRGVFITERIKQENIDPKEMAAYCYGDLSGLLLPRNRKIKAVEKLNSSWTGLPAESIKAIAALDADTNPGVIAVAAGALKAEAILAAIRGDYVTRLIVDRNLAGALSQLLK